MAPINFDLHCHTNASDGMLSPTDLIHRAVCNGVQVLAITDHDNMDGLPEAHQAAKDFPELRLISGVEISVTWANKNIHIVGLGINPQDTQLVEGLTRVRSGRLERAQAMADILQKITQHPGILEGALALAPSDELISRTHFARYLVAQGLVSSVADAFKQFLSEGRPAYVPTVWASLQESIQWITDAGGQAIIAHPGRYQLSGLVQDQLFTEFLSLGGVGIEVVTGSHHPSEYHIYAQHALTYGFMASCGSDFHSIPGQGMDVGHVPPLPKQLTPIWSTWSL